MGSTTRSLKRRRHSKRCFSFDRLVYTPMKVPIGRAEPQIPAYRGSDRFVFDSRLIGQVYWQHLTQSPFMTREFYVLFLDAAGNTGCEVLKGTGNWQHVTERFIDQGTESAMWETTVLFVSIAARPTWWKKVVVCWGNGVMDNKGVEGVKGLSYT